METKTPEQIEAEKKVLAEQKAAEKAAKAAEKAAAKEAAKAEKEAAKAAKLAEKNAAKEAAAAAKEAAKAEKAGALEAKKAEREAKKAEREAAKAAKEAARAATKMPEQNGVRRPKPEGLCGRAWAIMDRLTASTGATAKIADVLKDAETEGLNKSNVQAEYARWRKFHGITGRTVKTEVTTEATPAE